MPALPVYEGLDFYFKSMNDELQAITRLAGSFLDANSASNVLPQFWGQLAGFQASGSPGGRWEIPEDEPVRTRVSEGEYDSKGKRVYGTMSCVWELQCGEKRQRKTFTLVGLASTRLSIYEVSADADDRCLGTWAFEVGSHDSPGCHFHTDIKQPGEGTPWPWSFSVPRLPSILITPVDALDFLLGELFREGWSRHVSAGSEQVQVVGKAQRLRMIGLLGWKQRQLEASDGPAWMSLKKDKPERTVLLSGG